MSYEPLFLKYRPQKLADVLGQDSVKETLINAIQNNKIVHAYLLTGPRGSGKTSTARIIAKSLNCLSTPNNASATTDPCGTCESCVGITNSSSMDVTEIDAASHGGVEDARKLIERVNLASVSGKYRVYIIDEVHMLSTAAFNALLKVIEEPPANVVFILATTELDKVPKTIGSRCQQLKFKPITINDALTRLRYVAGLESINIEDNALRLIAEHSDGAMRDALSLFDQLSVFSNEQTAINEDKVLDIIGAVPSNELAQISKEILLRDSSQLTKMLDDLTARGKEPISITQELITFLLRLLESLSSKAPDAKLQDLISLCKERSIENYELVQIIDSLSELEIRLKQSSSQTKNLLKAWLIKITHRADILVVKDLLARIEKLEKGERPTSPAVQPITARSTETPVAIARSEATKQSHNTQSTTIDTQRPTQEEPSTNNSNNSFTDYLSPGSRGMLTSSQAQFIGVKDGVAQMKMPEKFKFLKSKLEARSEELISAIQKSSGKQVQSLTIEVMAAGEMLAANP